VLGHDPKRLHLFHELQRSSDDTPVATGEHMLPHVDRGAGATTAAAPEILQALAEIAESQRELPRPEGAGSGIDGTRVKAA
jgi:acyl-CoA thioesterase FadM